jgi:hypothetical protein
MNQVNRVGSTAMWLTLAIVSGAPAADWHGHLATLKQAQLACLVLTSLDCLPYLAEATAVADVLTATTKVSRENGRTAITAVFRNGNVQHCSENWLRQTLNGQRLMRDALALNSRSHFYWVDALLAAAQDRCHG